MSANIDLAEKIVNRITTVGDAQGFPSAGMVLTDLVGNLSMQQAVLTQPLARVPYTPESMQAVEAEIAKVYPPPRTSPFRIEEVIGEFKLVDPSGPGLINAIDKLSQLNWSDRRTVLKELATQSPSLGGQSYLATLQQALDALPNVDTAIRAAWMAARLGNAKHEVTTEDLNSWVKLTSHIIELPFQDMVEVFVSIGFRPDDVDGLVADMVADLEDLSGTGNTAWSPMMNSAILPGWLTELQNIVKNFDRTQMDFEEFKKPEKMPYGYFIGTVLHTAIAAWYRANHILDPTLPGEGLWTNTTPVESIFNFMKPAFKLHPNISDLGRSAALSRPDIFELVSVHDQPPGWVFEIKSAGPTGEGLALAIKEAAMYAAILNVWRIPAVPGPSAAVGTAMTIPAPGGWVAFASPAPGAIVYKRIKVPDERYKRKFPGTGDARQPVQAQTKAKIEAAVGAGAVLAAIVAAAYILAELFVTYGWVLIFL